MGLDRSQISGKAGGMEQAQPDRCDRFIATLASEAYRKQDEVGQFALLTLSLEVDDPAAQLVSLMDAMELVRANRGTPMALAKKGGGRRKKAAMGPSSLAFVAWVKLRREQGVPDRDLTPTRMNAEIAADTYQIPSEHLPGKKGRT